MPKSSSGEKARRSAIATNVGQRYIGIQSRSSKIVDSQKSNAVYRDAYERAIILREAGATAPAENQAVKIIQKVTASEPLTPEEQAYEISSPEELQGTLLPTLEWQYSRKQDRYVRTRAAVSLDQQIDLCLDLLNKPALTLKDLPSDFGWSEHNAVELVYNEKGQECFFRRLLADLHNAQRHIHIAMFGMKGRIGCDEDIAWQVAKLLAEKAATGVEVKLLLDAKGCGFTKLGPSPEMQALRQWMEAHQIKIVVNHPFRPFDLQRFLRLDHRKFYLIDGEIGYCGGMGIENHFFYDWFDVMLRLQGDIVNQLQMHFLSTWCWQGGSRDDWQQPKAALRQRYFPHLNRRAGNQKTKLLVNIPAPGNRKINDAYVEAINATHTSFYFMNPYCFTDWLVAELHGLAEKLFKKGLVWQPQMKVPNGVLAMFPREGFDFPMLDALQHEYKGLKRADVGLVIYRGVLHGKLYVQDSRLSNVGSFNIDDASLERNWETNILVEDETFAQHLLQELFFKKEPNVDIKVESELKFSLFQTTKQAFADAIDFVI